MRKRVVVVIDWAEQKRVGVVIDCPDTCPRGHGIKFEQWCEN